jgi:hypothetical protein
VPRETQFALPKGQSRLRAKLWDEGISGQAFAKHENTTAPWNKEGAANSFSCINIPNVRSK